LELRAAERFFVGAEADVTLTDIAEQSERTTQTRRAALIVNAHARSGEDAYAAAKEMLQQKGLALGTAVAVREPQRIPDIVAQALAQGHSLVIVGGGDGTIRAAANALAGKDAACGILPLGTANSFARSLNVPLDLDGAVDVLLQGRTKQVDVGLIGDKCFLTAVAIGLSPEIHRRKPHKLKYLLGRLAYPAVASMVLPPFRPFACSLALDTGERRDIPAVLELRIANTPYEGGVEAAPDASPTSGDLVVHIVSGTSKWRLIRTWGKIVAGLEPDGPGYEELRTTGVTIETDPPQGVNVDGEAAMTTPVDLRIARKALRVIVPGER
jgi:YegS/Rv2252/BmrU family lipid kinase